MCGPWLILSPFAGAFIGALVSSWGGERKTKGSAWGFLLGFIGMLVYLGTFCHPK
jgi:uncharacterized protein YqgC (DUF456 family)